MNFLDFPQVPTHPVLPNAPTHPVVPFPKAPTRNPSLTPEAEESLRRTINETAGIINKHIECVKSRSMTAAQLNEVQKLYDDAWALWKKKGLGGSRKRKKMKKRSRTVKRIR
jgi:septal ring-binding cell division protein DamX